jgi:uncharacterized protein
MAAVRFIDANVLLRALTGSEPAQAAASRGLLLRVEAGEEKITTSPLVLFEVIFTLHSKRSYNYPKERVAELLSPIIEMRGLQLPHKQLWLDALAAWLQYPIDFTDAYKVVIMESSGVVEVYAWDKGYDHVHTIRRLEPSEMAEEEAA